MADSLACHEVLGGSPGTQQSNDEQYMLHKLECDLKKIRHSCGLFMREEAAVFRSDIDTMVASIQETLAHNSWQIDEIRKRLVRYDVEIEKIKEKYDQEIQGIKAANALNQELIMAKIDAAKREGEMFTFKVDEMMLNQLVMAKIDAAKHEREMYVFKVDKMREKEKKGKKVEESSTCKCLL